MKAPLIKTDPVLSIIPTQKPSFLTSAQTLIIENMSGAVDLCEITGTEVRGHVCEITGRGHVCEITGTQVRGHVCEITGTGSEVTCVR